MKAASKSVLLLLWGCLLVIAVHGYKAPSPPMWDNVFKFVASAYNTTSKQVASTQYHYRWDIPAVAQVNTNAYGQGFIILHVNNNTWRVNPGQGTCCLCVDEYACGHVTPPTPDWLRKGNTTEYLGVTAINERLCNGWAKSDPVAKFGWWTSVKDNTPCQLSWMLGTTVNMVMSYYTNDPAMVPANIFTVPSYCPYVPTDPKCNISEF